MRFIYLLALLFFFSPIVIGQPHSFVPQEFIIQFDSQVELRYFLLEHSVFKGKATKLKIEQELVPNSGIYLLSYNNKEITQNDFLKELVSDPWVVLAQNNHYLDLRSTIPNDPSFSDQWQHLNSGQLGGTLNIDMDSDLAWDRTIGGYTVSGDTIVVAVIDNGCQISHPDLDANIWYNKAEIPNNNLDDDNNGYIDDYKGWNTNLNNDDVDLNGGGSQHGTEATGLIGAEGNNALGVAGVNWTVKLMIIRNGFNTTEANVIIAYGYALQARRRYNQTNGQEGAFVVATNASWGIDYGQPANAPIWCAFYDSLGAVGILNVGATTNNSEDVDIVGDLPTTCPSDFMIGVTGHNRFGSLSGGYGDMHIDIAAPTGSVRTTSNNSSYGSFGGTSAAAPQVAGAIALAYAGACSDFMQLAKSQPDLAAMEVKQAILNGHSPAGGLVGFTAVGGRLNLDGMLQALVCPSDSCFAVQNLVQTNSSNSSVEISWQTTSDTAFYRWRLQGDSSWQGNLFSTTTLATIPNLASCSSYEIEVFAICDSSWSPATSLLITTFGCCELPTDLSLHAVNQSQASFQWQQPLGIDSFLLRWQVYNDTTWDSVAITANTYNLSNLEACTYYKLQVKSLCNDSLSAFSSPLIFATNGCPACGVSGYCDMRGTNSSADWIERFEIGGLEFTSGNNGGYSSFDSTNIQLNTGIEIPFEIEQGNAFLEKIRIWIDVNRDGDFTDGNELIYDGELNFSTMLQDSLMLPFIWPGRTKIRLAMRWNTAPNLCENFQNGEVEDYCVNILPPSAVLESHNDLEVNLYPNPNHGSFYLETELDGQLEIYNNLGQVVYQKQVSREVASHQIELGEELSQGLYYLNFKTEYQTKTIKFFKY